MNQLGIVVALLVVLGVSAFFVFNTVSTDSSPMVEEMTALVRVAHLSPDAPNVDVWVDGARVLENVPYEAFSGYLSLPAGPHRIQVSPAGQAEPIVIDATVDVAAGRAYTVAATGLLGQGELSPIVLNDDLMQAETRAKVRFVHTSPDAPAVDVAVVGGPVLFDGTAFRQDGGYLSVAPGDYDLEVRLAGTETVVLSLPGVTLEAGANLSVFAVGQVGDQTLGALIALDAAL